MSLSRHGDVILLDSQHSLFLLKLRVDGEPVKLIVPTGGSSTFESFKFTRVQFDEDGRRLLLASGKTLAIVEIPKIVRPHGEIEVSKLDNNPLQFEVLSRDVEVVKATFHSLSDYHVVALVKKTKDGSASAPENFLEIFSLIEATGAASRSRKIPLRSCEWVSFCFGNEYDWACLTVFLLSVDGRVYYLCPVLPIGSEVSTVSVDALWQWNREFGKVNEGRIKAYLEAAFSYTDSDRYKRAGGGFRGPARTTLSKVAAEQCEKRFLAEPSEQLVHGTQHPSDPRTTAVDSCMPVVRGGAPVLIISYSDGTVTHWLPASNNNASFVGPRWTDQAQDIAHTQPPALHMIEVQTVFCPPGQYHLMPDPVFEQFLHVVEFAKSRVFLVQASWLSASVLAEGGGGAPEAAEEPFPVYAPSGAGAGAGAVEVSKTSAPPALAACCIVQDPQLSHLALFHDAHTGAIVQVNIHTHIAQLRDVFSEANYSAMAVSGAGAGAAGAGGRRGGGVDPRFVATRKGNHLDDAHRKKIRDAIESCMKGAVLAGGGGEGGEGGEGGAGGGGGLVAGSHDYNSLALKTTQRLEQDVLHPLEHAAHLVIDQVSDIPITHSLTHSPPSLSLYQNDNSSIYYIL